MQRRKFIQSAILNGSLISLAPLAEMGEWRKAHQTEVINAGVGGNNTNDLLARMDADCLTHHPDLTILMAGTNDMNSRKYIPINEYEKNMQKLVNAIRKMKSKIVLMNLLPVYEPYLFMRHKREFYEPEGHQGRLLQMNARIKEITRRNQLTFLNLHHIFTTIGNIGLDASSLIRNEANSKSTDGLHPTGDGYRVIALTVYDHIIYNKLPSKKIVCFGDSITLGAGLADGANYPAYLRKLFAQ